MFEFEFELSLALDFLAGFKFCSISKFKKFWLWLEAWFDLELWEIGSVEIDEESRISN